MNRRVLAALVFLLLLGSCATLRIDVDVYKGPLANDEQVQIQELIALAIGAKPLVVQLRDSADATARTKSVRDWRKEEMGTQYKSTWMDQGDNQREPTFVSALARNANEVLGLYEDISTVESDPELALLREDLDRYSEALSIVNRTDPLEARLEDRILTRLDALDRASASGAASKIDALRQFFTLDARGYRGAEALGRAMLASGIALTTTDPVSKEVVTWSTESAQGMPFGATAWYGALESSEAWSKLIQATDAENRWPKELGQDIATAGPSIARSFRVAREMLRRVMQRSAQFARREGAAAKDDSGRLATATSALDLAVLATSSQFVHQIMTATDLSLGEGQSQLRRLLDEVVAKLRGRLDPLFERRKERTPETKQRLALFLDMCSEQSKRPIAECIVWLADALLEADDWVQSQGADDPKFRQPRPELEPTRARALRRVELMFGLAAGPVPLDSSNSTSPTGRLADPNFLRSELDSLSHSGLHGGRLEQGIEALVTDYLRKQKSGSTDLRDTERTLLMDLIRFGEKLRVLSGFQDLVDSEGSRGYMDVLQAIANSILTQADALQRSRGVLDSSDDKCEQATRDKRATAIEKRGGEEGTKFAQSPELQMPGDSPGATPREVLLEYATRLKYLIATELAHNGESDRLKHLRLAAAYVEEKRSELAELRLAAAYLRNAYPAPDLQQTPLPLVPGILHGDQSLAPDRRKTAEQLDKQFWQNVNHIALRGIGDANYVVAKDDIGNWQVKAYSADTSRIMSSLANLASFVSQAGLSPGAIAGAAELRKLVDKTRRGSKLNEDESKRMKEIGEQRDAASAARKAQQSVVAAALKQAAELNAELRKHLTGTMSNSTDGKSPTEDVKPATLTEGDAAASLTALEAEFVALFKLEKDSTRAAALAPFKQRRLDQLRGLQLQLLQSAPKSKS